MAAVTLRGRPLALSPVVVGKQTRRRLVVRESVARREVDLWIVRQHSVNEEEHRPIFASDGVNKLPPLHRSIALLKSLKAAPPVLFGPEVSPVVRHGGEPGRQIIGQCQMQEDNGKVYQHQ